MTWFIDFYAVLVRNLQRLKRTPEVVIFGLIQPIMFVLLFSQVFGGAIALPGASYIDYMLPGILAQSTIFGASVSGMMIAQDKKDGIMDRFRILPISRSAIIFARATADGLINVMSAAVMVLTGLALGWRAHTSLWEFLAGFGLLALFGWAFSFLLIFLGFAVKTPEALNSASFIVMFPATFLSNGFVPTQTMPKFLSTIATWNPVSAIVQAVRNLFGGNGDLPVPDVWAMQHPVLFVLIASTICVAIFAPLSVSRVSTHT
ncbi:ABC transporter permease [Corynebacterium choanae]|uniref:Transport permease protein n=1 Tax=Corynebacterium choanae TaxID=1862358 RepID=A0A3G6JDI8_9CORY|nr:ABC transporter permease [Corynebacterium choanae]AZA14214.1 Daunorubicin/doxorubicin resistance ABC transporter permease protein DrrB [Corynebacterium choanae]